MKQVDKVVVWSGWAWTDAQAAMNCPKCGSLAGEPCRMPSGRKTWPPHVERSAALNQTEYGAKKINARPVVNAAQLFDQLKKGS